MRKMKMFAATVAAAAVLMAGCGQEAVQETVGTEAAQESSETIVIEGTSDPVEEAGIEETEAKETTAEETAAKETEAKETAAEETTAAGKNADEKAAAGEQADGKSAGTYKDNFEVDSAAAADFAGQIQKAVAEKDLEGLADLTAFPVYVGLPDVGGVETREDFLALGADAVFAQELVDAVSAADTANLAPSMAGFVLSDGGTANIVFGVRDGQLAVTGINY